ncbi:hypothetical protein [Streptomyces sp. NPDC059389]|uniref:hypothetical protein n=1 Tax=Streptomyces sp. NPDC059389 TaxID=3346818 RepID=UPI0036B93DA9
MHATDLPAEAAVSVRARHMSRHRKEVIAWRRSFVASSVTTSDSPIPAPGIAEEVNSMKKNVVRRVVNSRI